MLICIAAKEPLWAQTVQSWSVNTLISLPKARLPNKISNVASSCFLKEIPVSLAHPVELNTGLILVVMLTPREREVLGLLACGLSAKEIARKLSITARTVESHVDKLRLKTRTRNRTHMVAQAIQQGLL